MSELKNIVEQADRLGLTFSHNFDVPGYEALELVLSLAYAQAAEGKGKERHANDLPFHAQPMQRESDDLESSVGLLYQARKKIREGATLPTDERMIKEWLGAINYVAGAVIYALRHPAEEEQMTAQGITALAKPVSEEVLGWVPDQVCEPLPVAEADFEPKVSFYAHPCSDTGCPL